MNIIFPTSVSIFVPFLSDLYYLYDTLTFPSATGSLQLIQPDEAFFRLVFDTGGLMLLVMQTNMASDQPVFVDVMGLHPGDFYLVFQPELK